MRGALIRLSAVNPLTLFRESLEIFERLGVPEADAERVREWLEQVSTDASHNRSA